MKTSKPYTLRRTNEEIDGRVSMSKRIEEIARKASALATTKDAFEEYIVYFDAEKFEQEFAELLIKECITKCKTDWHGDSLDDICVQMLEHFGIKE